MRTTRQQDSELTRILLEDVDLDASIAIDWVRNTFEPQDVFSKAELAQWALDNGFVEEK